MKRIRLPLCFVLLAYLLWSDTADFAFAAIIVILAL